MILVTGATGTTGRALVQQLSAKGIATRALVRDVQKAKDLQLPHVELALGDLGDAASVTQALQGITSAYLLSSGAPESVALQNGFIDLAKAAGVRRVVKHSGLGASLDSPIHLARWHAEVEAHLAASGLEYTILSPHAFMQNLLWDVGTIKAQNAIYAPMADASFSLIDARDIAAAAVTVLTEAGHHGQNYALTGGTAYSYHDIAAALSRQLEKEIAYVPMDFDSYLQGALAAGFPQWLAEDMTNLFRFFASGAVDFISPAVAQLSGRAPTSLQQFVADYQTAFA